jgi:hypothetical protein
MKRITDPLVCFLVPKLAQLTSLQLFERRSSRMFASAFSTRYNIATHILSPLICAIMDENPHRTEEHPLSEKQGNTDESKLSTAVAAIADPKFPLPALTDKSSTLRYILSFGTLATLLATSIVGAWYLDVTMLQSEQPIVVLSVAFFAVLGALFFTGTVWIDWFELVMGYWWLSMPIAAAAGLVLVMNQEQSTGIQESA